MEQFDHDQKTSEKEVLNKDNYDMELSKNSFSKMETQVKELKKENRFLNRWIYIASVICIVVGLIIGSIFPIPHLFNSYFAGSSTTALQEKMKAVLRLMESDWFFANEIDHVEEHLVDQALVGMTSNEIDPHSNYLSKEQIQEFMAHLNRSFVGIGIEYSATSDGLHIVQKVLKNSPAEKAGVLPGDIIHAVDDRIVDHLENSEISEMVRGEAGTSVKIDFLRNGKTVSLHIVREEIHNTTSGEIQDDIGYLQIMQFGDSTDKEVRAYLEEFKSHDISKLIIDLRNDGGGYLEALRGIVNCLLPKDTLFLKRQYTDGHVEESYTDGEEIEGFEKIVLLVNENTASASEALTMALREQHPNTTVVGTKTYGKGTVQITRSFTDGSALKYTNSKWLSPKGVWINNKGIEPDVVVSLPKILEAAFSKMDEGVVLEQDSVSEYTSLSQKSLNYLGYGPLREDGYFDTKTKKALEKYQVDHDLEPTGKLDEACYSTIISSVILDWSTHPEKDTQLAKAKEILHG